MISNLATEHAIDYDISPVSIALLCRSKQPVRWYFSHSNRPITRSIQNKKPYVRILGIGFYNSNG